MLSVYESSKNQLDPVRNGPSADRLHQYASMSAVDGLLSGRSQIYGMAFTLF
jgi:hypothetical protein